MSVTQGVWVSYTQCLARGNVTPVDGCEYYSLVWPPTSNNFIPGDPTLVKVSIRTEVISKQWLATCQSVIITKTIVRPQDWQPPEVKLCSELREPWTSQESYFRLDFAFSWNEVSLWTAVHRLQTPQVDGPQPPRRLASIRCQTPDEQNQLRYYYYFFVKQLSF